MGRADPERSSWECFSGTDERRLGDHRRLFQTMFESAGIGMAVMDLEGRFLMANRCLREMLGYDIGELVGMRLEDITHPEDYPPEHGILRESLRTDRESKYHAQKRYRRKDGSVFWGNLTATIMRAADGRPLYGVGTVEDITERMEVEKVRAAFTRRIVRIEEESRRRFSRDLHDILGPELTALGFDLNTVLLLAPVDLPERVIRHLHDCVSRVKEITRSMRNLMADLRPPVLDEFGLAAALRWQAEQLSNLTGLRVTVEAEEPVPRLALDVETALFRIAQEALTNAVRHAEAQWQRVTLEALPAVVRLAVEDDGIGFVQEVKPVPELQHWGLIHMRERAHGIGGRLTIHSTPGAGTRIEVEIPMSPAAGVAVTPGGSS